MQKMQQKLKVYMQTYSEGIQSLKSFQKMLDEYEDKSLPQYTDTWSSPDEYRVFSSTKKAEGGEGKDEEPLPSQTPEKLKEAHEKLIDNLKNPYYSLYHWCEGEMFDIQAVLQAIAQRDKGAGQLKKHEKMKDSQTSELQAAKEGRTTVKAMVKRTDAAKMEEKLEKLEQANELLGQITKI